MDLGRIIAAEIREREPIPFSRFMELALYHPDLGYYAGDRDPFGRDGDFFTNAQLQPVFGRLLAQQVDRWRRAMGSPDGFTVLELGSGRGETGEEIRRCLPEINWVAVDQGDPWPDRPVVGVVLCNEFFDALPVDLVQRDGTGWFELRVGLVSDSFAWQLGDCVEGRQFLPRIPDGQRIETCERQLDALGRIHAALEAGWLLAIDYGYTRYEIEPGGRFADGTLMSYRGHRADPRVLLEPGCRDITAHVNFSALVDHGRTVGFEVFPLQTQQAFLIEVGKPDRFAYALDASTQRERFDLRMQLKTLLYGMGETFRVLRMRKGQRYTQTQE